MHPEDATRITHAMQIDDLDAQGTRRLVSLCLLDNECYGLSITTKWADEAESHSTHVSLTPRGLQLLTELLIVGSTDMLDYPNPEREHEAQPAA